MPVKRKNFSSGSSYEDEYGYSRCVKVGDTVYVSGTIGYNYETGEISDDPVEQVRQIIRNIEPSLNEAGAKLTDVVQLTTYVTAPETFYQIGPTLKEIFNDIRPTNAALVIAFPYDDVVAVELRMIAVVGCGD